MLNKYILLTLMMFWLACLDAASQQKHISGFVIDKNNGEKLIGCNVVLKGDNTGTSTDEYGFFSMSLSENGTKDIIISYIGYESKEIDCNKFADFVLMIELEPNLEIPEVFISKSTPQSLETSSMLTINPAEVKKMPSFFGEKDILRTLQLKAGIQMGKEGSTGMIVRGGGADQNQFLVDGVPLYYVQHIGNLLSTFNPDALKSAYLIKGGFPAHYGGRLSSITDIRLKDGNINKLTGSWTLGTIAFKGHIEGPLNASTTFFLSGRRCNLDLFTRVLSLIDSDGKGVAGYTFYDANLKIRHKIDDRNSLYLTFFSNMDRIFLRFWDNDTVQDVGYNFKSEMTWGNHFASLRLNHLYNSKNIGDFSIAHSYFNYTNNIKLNAKTQDKTLYNQELLSGTSINESIIKYDHNYNFGNSLRFKFGGGMLFHHFMPNRDFMIDSLVWRIPEFYSYTEAIFTPFKFLNINTGLRSTLFLQEENKIFLPEPRVSMKASIKKMTSITFSYSRMSQLVHLVSDNKGGIPVDIWMPATKDIPPEISNQISLGFEHKASTALGILISIEGFYKKQKNLIELRSGNNIFSVLDDPKSSLSNNGIGSIWGIEGLLEKKKGRLTGWLSYMYIVNQRQFADINQGISYPFIYDKPHNLNSVLMTKLSKNINLSLTWQVSSGNLFTLPISKYSVPIIYFGNESTSGEAHLYGSKNSTRLDPYHRLDVSLDFFKQLNDGSRIFNISIYNAYNKQNPFFLFYKENSQGVNSLYQLCLFPIFPSISYRYDF